MNDKLQKRIKGEFFTKKLFVDQAHLYISNFLGNDWKEKYVVWDCCCGTNNLTKEYEFDNLYLSTLELQDINNINANCIKFQFDFLNDDYDYLPKSLKNLIEEKKPILIFINPPYFKANPKKGIDGTNISKTAIGEEMRINKFGMASSQLSTQFLYRILKLKKINPNIKIAVFNIPNYMTSSGFKIFRNSFLNEFGFLGGFLFNASNFSDTSNRWGITFSIWDDISNKKKNEFIHDVLECENNIILKSNTKKIIYNCDGLIKSNMFFKQTKEKKYILLPPVKSFITIDENVEKPEAGNYDAIGYMNNHSNNAYQRAMIFLASSVISTTAGQAITEKNLYKALALFTARKSILPNWINDKDEYLAPNEQHEQWEQFTIDSIVYSLFNASSQQSSMRNIFYKNKFWNIKNEFFWLSKNDIMLLTKDSYVELYDDAYTQENRYIHDLLFGSKQLYNKLSQDAQDVLNSATELLKKSIQKRKELSNQYPEYHLDAYDAGYAQLKLVWKEFFLEEYRIFKKKYKKLEQRLKQNVYILGYLR